MVFRGSRNNAAVRPPTRRRVVAGLVTLAAMPAASGGAHAQAWNDIARRIEKLAGKAEIKRGRVSLELPELAENGNLVPLSITVESPMTAGDHVVSIHVFSERNPLSTLLAVYLGADAGQAHVQTNIRLATSQTVTAIARMSDGSFWSGTARTDVGIAACVDGG